MPLLASDIIDRVADILHEDFGTNALWTRAELLKYVDQAQREIARRTRGLALLQEITPAQGTAAYDLPDLAFTPVYLSYNGQELSPATIQDLELKDQAWSETSGTPTTWYQETLGPNQVGLYPKPNINGSTQRGVVRRITIDDGAGAVDQTLDSSYGVVRRETWSLGATTFVGNGEVQMHISTAFTVSSQTGNLVMVNLVHPETIDEEVDKLMINTAYDFLVRDYVIWRALEREGDGQNMERAAHWRERFDGLTDLLATLI